MKITKQRRFRGGMARSVALPLASAAVVGGIVWASNTQSDIGKPAALGELVVIAYNDLGMHCMNQDFSEICILPPYNNFRATVIDRTHGSPEIVTQGVSLQYWIPGNTVSHTKTNFWDFDQALFGVNLPLDVGLAGFGLSGNMVRVSGANDFMAGGVPITPITDLGANDPFQLAHVQVVRNGAVKDTTYNVMPVSWEIRCDMCHTAHDGLSVAGDILARHDRKHGTDLANHKPVLCAACHADPALGTPGLPGVKSMSAAMHGAHAKRPMPMGPKQPAGELCYNCHPGNQTQCLRDVHYARGMKCESCHGGMKAVGNPNRTPWVDEPSCGSCHHVPGHEYEQPGVLFRNSVGHGGVKCIVCHNSPHAIVATTTDRDNQQSLRVQGHTGTLNTCTVCHSQQPGDPFPHRRND